MSEFGAFISGDNGGDSIRFERSLAGAPERVWDYLTQSELMSEWLGAGEIEAKVGGKLAQLGSRIVDGFAKKMADQFFTRLEQVIEGPDEDDNEPEAKKKGWLKRLIS